jgi:hypothetical protein
MDGFEEYTFARERLRWQDSYAKWLSGVIVRLLTRHDGRMRRAASDQGIYDRAADGSQAAPHARARVRTHSPRGGGRVE